jgi:hypothetical protein
MTKNFDLGRLVIGYYLVIGIWLLVIFHKGCSGLEKNGVVD